MLTCSHVLLQMFSLLQQQKTESLDFVSFSPHASPLRLRLHVVSYVTILMNAILINTVNASKRYSAAVCSMSSFGDCLACVQSQSVETGL